MTPRQTTPSHIVDRFISIAQSVAGTCPEFIDVEPTRNSKTGFCFQNVEGCVLSNGGKPISGWIVWDWLGVFTELEHHCVWERPDGSIVDITPQRDGERRILFIPDPSAPLDAKNRTRLNLRFPYPRNKIAKQYCAARDAVDKYADVYRTTESSSDPSVIIPPYARLGIRDKMIRQDVLFRKLHKLHK